MSESNKKKRKINSIVLFLFIYAIIAICVTFYLIYEKNDGKIDNQVLSGVINKNEEDEKFDYNNIQRINLTDKYYVNNIKIEVKEKNLGEIVTESNSYTNMPRYKVEMRFPKISGLMDEKVQNQINSDIEKKIDNFIKKEELNNENIDTINISADINGNFSDVLSVGIYKTTFFKNEEYESEYIGANFRLDTGEEIKFSDLFTEDASIKNIIAQSAYNNLGFEYGVYSNENIDSLEGNMDKIDYSKVENDVYRLVSKYNRNPEIEFYFTYNTILAMIDSKSMVSIKMNDFYEYMNIYNLVFTKESLYTEGDNEKVNYVFGAPIFEGYRYFDKISDKTFLGIYNASAAYIDENIYDESYEETEKVIKKYTDKIIDGIKEKEENNPKAQIYNITFLHITEDGTLNATAEKVEVDKKELDGKIEEVFSKASRQTAGEAIIYLLGLYEEYDVYNVEITEKNGKLEFKQTDMNSYFDI